mgnify:CR=1 FL=1
MCCRYALTLAGKLDQISFPEESVQLELELPWECYNIAPTVQAPILDHDRTLKLSRWGLIPHWAKEPLKRPLFNARSETAASKNSFRTAYKEHRCAVPASGYFEWFQPPEQDKQPHFVRPQVEDLFWFAGLACDWSAKGSEEAQSTFTILTRSSEGLPVAWLHDRSPIPLAWDDVKLWLDREIEVEDLESKHLFAAPYRVSTAVNSVRNDTPENIEPVE